MAPPRPSPRRLTRAATILIRTRWGTRAVAAVVLAGGLSGWAAVWTGGKATPRLATLGVFATALVAAGLVGRSAEVLAGGIGGVVTLCAVAVAVEPGPIALGVGVGVFALAEAAFAAVDLEPFGTSPATVPAAADAQRRRYLGAVVALSLLAGTLALVVADGVATSGNLAVEALGVVAILGVAGLVVSLSHQAKPPRHMG